MTTSDAASTVSINETLPSSQIEQFKKDGFTSIPQLIDSETLHKLQHFYDQIIRNEITIPTDRQLGGVTRQIMHPRMYIPYFMDNPAVQRGMKIAAQLLGTTNLELCFDMLIYKPPMHPKATPWHQDVSYNEMPFLAEGSAISNNSVQFWVALDDVDVENGCMHFLPGYHLQSLKKHYVYAGDPTNEGRLLATAAFGDADLPNAGVAFPLSAGGATIHFYGTPHYTPPNTSTTRGRRAYIFNIRARSVG